MINEIATHDYKKRSESILSEDQRLDLLAEFILDRIIAKITNDRADTILKKTQEKEMLKV